MHFLITVHTLANSGAPESQRGTIERRVGWSDQLFAAPRWELTGEGGGGLICRYVPLAD